MAQVNPFDGFPLPGVRRQMIGDMNVPNHQDLAIGNDIATHFGGQIIAAQGDLTRFQRAGKGAQQSAAGCRDDIIECRRMGNFDLLAPAPVMFGNRAMGPEQDRFLLCRQVGPSQELLLTPLNTYPGNICWLVVVHFFLLLPVPRLA